MPSSHRASSTSRMTFNMDDLQPRTTCERRYRDALVLRRNACSCSDFACACCTFDCTKSRASAARPWAFWLTPWAFSFICSTPALALSAMSR